ncbi:gliding motility-associated C-terminal domain-containing protein [Runella sp.]|uniref:gliding motility-associated C-terminal domain-containing protein n=1 Tax=Runella sp. TaxID=1960881 RepID=UPI003D10FF41
MQFWYSLYRIILLLFQQQQLTSPIKRILLFLGGWFIVSSSFGQQINDNQCNSLPPGTLSGEFGLVNEVGCAPLQVGISNKQIVSVKNRYIFDYKGGSPDTYKTTTDSSFTYTKSGLYVVMKLSESSTGQLQRACKVVTVQNPTPPEFRVLICSNGTAALSITNHAITEYEEYVIEWGDGNVTIINKFNLFAQYRYQDNSSKTITVQGRHRVSNCVKKSSKTISLESNSKPATISKLEILDATTGELTISNPNLLELEVYRQEGAGVFKTLGTIVKNADEKVRVLVDTNKIFCYKIKPRDSCAATLESNVVCSSFIRITRESDANVVSIQPYLHPSEVKTMTVKRNDTVWWNPTVTQWFRPDNEGQCGKETCYRLEINTQDALIISNRICAEPPPSLCNPLGHLFVPDVFTPNGDGVNDLFEVKGEVDGDPQILIYDRWGSVIFHNSINVRNWNGAINGSPAPPGAYLYRINVTDKVGRTFVKRGTVSLLR